MPSPKRGDPGREDDVNRILPDIDPVPPEAVEAAKAVFAPGTHHELATLAHDSLLEGEGSRQRRVLRFEHARAAIELLIHTGTPVTVIEGSVEPRGPSTAVLHIHGTELAIVVPIEDRAFTFTAIGRGTVRISLESDSGPDPIWTESFRI